MSTWLMWEHHLVDILGGMALSIVVMRFAPSPSPAAGISANRMGRIVLPGTMRPLLATPFPLFRDFPRHLCAVAAALEALSSRTHRFLHCAMDRRPAGWRSPFRARTVRCDRRADRGDDAPVVLAGSHSRVLTGALFAELPPRARGEFIALARTMQRDRRRVLGGEVWSREELDAHHHATFALSVNLMLQTAGCHARARTGAVAHRGADLVLRIPRPGRRSAQRADQHPARRVIRCTWHMGSPVLRPRPPRRSERAGGRNRARRRYSRASHPGNLSNLDRGVSPERSEGHTLGKERPLIRLRHLLPSHEGRRLTDHASRKIRSTGHASRRNQHWVAFSLLPFSPSQPHRDGEKGT